MDWDSLEEIGALGEGSFATAKLMRYRGLLVAVKLLPREIVISRQRYVDSEVRNHRNLRHEAVCQFYCTVQAPEHLGICMEYCSRGNMVRFLSEMGNRLNEDGCCFFFRQLIEGLYYIHEEMGVCHRDFKLENILVDGQDLPRIKIADFGYAKNFDSNPRTKVGTLAYMSPEVLSNLKLDENDQPLTREGPMYNGKAVDIWALGVCLFRMLCGNDPFPGHEHRRDFSELHDSEAWRYKLPDVVARSISPECHNILARMLEPHPQSRITITEIRSHSWTKRQLSGEMNSVPLPRRLDESEMARIAHLNIHQTEEEIKSMVDSLASVNNPNTLRAPSGFNDGHHSDRPRDVHTGTTATASPRGSRPQSPYRVYSHDAQSGHRRAPRRPPPQPPSLRASSSNSNNGLIPPPAHRGDYPTGQLPALPPALPAAEHGYRYHASPAGPYGGVGHHPHLHPHHYHPHPQLHPHPHPHPHPHHHPHPPIAHPMNAMMNDELPQEHQQLHAPLSHSANNNAAAVAAAAAEMHRFRHTPIRRAPPPPPPNPNGNANAAAAHYHHHHYNDVPYHPTENFHDILQMANHQGQYFN